MALSEDSVDALAVIQDRLYVAVDNQLLAPDRDTGALRFAIGEAR